MNNSSQAVAMPAGAGSRLLSLDLLRGFTIAAMILVNTPGDWEHVYHPLTHSEWNGCTPTDVIFPGFIFMAGVSVVFALGKKKAAKEEHGAVIVRALRRMLLLIAIGLGIALVYHFDLAHLRFFGVLQRIAIVYFIATVLYLKLDGGGLHIVSASLLVLYYALFLIPFPGAVSDAFDPVHNIVAYTDHQIFSDAHLYKYAYTDPCGLLSTLPAIVTALLGIHAGTLLKQKEFSAELKTVKLLITGVLLIAAGLAAGLFFPVNKPLWSSSYVLYTGGICMCCLGITYWFFDVKQRGSGLWPLLVFGTNAIFAYMVAETLPRLLNLLVCTVHGTRVGGQKIVYALLSGICTPETASLLSALAYVVLIWVLMLYLYRKKIIIKV